MHILKDRYPILPSLPLSLLSSDFEFPPLVSVNDFIVSLCVVRFAVYGLSQGSLFSDLCLFPLYF